MNKGIRARTGRRGFGQTPWGHRWVEVLERFHSEGRLSRGRSYARAGHVLSLQVTVHGVTARVQGSHVTPYRVTLALSPLPETVLDALKELAQRPDFTAAFAQGDLPDTLEEELDRRGFHLFPDSLEEFESACSCPDWESPCKHIAAVYYLIAEELDRDPLLLFALRGVPRDRVQEALAGDGMGKVAPHQDLPEDPDAFWLGGPIPEMRPPTLENDAAVLRLLGRFPFWPGTGDLREVLLPVYRAAGSFAEEELLKEADAERQL